MQLVGGCWLEHPLKRLTVKYMSGRVYVCLIAYGVGQGHGVVENQCWVEVQCWMLVVQQDV